MNIKTEKKKNGNLGIQVLKEGVNGRLPLRILSYITQSLTTSCDYHVYTNQVVYTYLHLLHQQ